MKEFISRFLRPRATEPAARNVADFLAALSMVAPPAGRGDYAFANAEGRSCGIVQFLICSDRELIIHRLWSRQPGRGSGSMMLRTLCKLADQHEVALTLKALPFGCKPYPMSGDALLAWYRRHGFDGTRKKMTRRPRAIADDPVFSRTSS